MKILLIALGVLLISVVAYASEVSFEWDANPEPDISHYELYTGTQSGVYDDFEIVIGTTHTLTVANSGNDYYFALKAVNSSDKKSDYSNEVTTFIPSDPSAPVSLRISGTFDITVSQ